MFAKQLRMLRSQHRAVSRAILHDGPWHTHWSPTRYPPAIAHVTEDHLYPLIRDKPRLFSTSENVSNENTKNPITPKQSLEFQAETRQLLDIVTHSLYTDKEVFLRELISNASDALEKLRHLQTLADTETILEPDTPLEIRIETDEANGTLTITDTGIGLSRDDMIANLGTIARSGSKAFVQEMSARYGGENNATPETDISRGIIGKFGVGFYSAFMVGDIVEVRSK
jgi:hypothetical protein